MDPNAAADAFVKVLKALNLKRVAFLAILLIEVGVGVAFWLNRDSLVTVFQPAKLSLVSEPIALTPDVLRISERFLKDQHTLINTVGIISVNAPGNTRRIVLFKSNDVRIMEQFEKAVNTSVSRDLPLITSNKQDNETLIRLLNGELVCRPWSESVSSRYLANVDVKYVCSVGIPPSYGRFRGIVMIYLCAVPDEIQEHQVRVLLKNLSLELDNPRNVS